MLMMPYLRGVVRPSIPVGVILLVTINVLVFFGFQQRDGSRYQIAFDYYEHSILKKIEPEAYLEYLKAHGEEKQREEFEKLHKRDQTIHALRKMEDNDAFMRALRADQIVRPDNPDYGQWKQARQYFDGVINSVTSERYAFRTDHPSLLTAFTHQFLHGDTGHIVGNMIVLILIAPAVEALIGTPLFLLVYLIGGLGAVAVHWLIVGSGSGLVGASGAISAAMGAFAVLLRWRRIPFFYFVVVYFDIVRAPALLALPIWLANEVAQLFWFGSEHVAYGAHIGGLLTGGLLAWPLVRRAQARLLEPGAPADQPDGTPDQTQMLERHLTRARRFMRDHSYDEARQAYLQAAAHAGGDLEVWRECLNVAKLAPASPEYHKLVRALLRKTGRDAATHQLLLDTFRDYITLAQPRPNLDAELLVKLAERFQERGCVPELERTARLLHRVAPAHARCRDILLAAASGQYGAGNKMKAEELTRMADAASA